MVEHVNGNDKGFTVNSIGAVKNRSKPRYIADVFKITRSVLLTLGPIQQIHIINRNGVVDENIKVTEQELARLFKGSYTMYILGKYDPINNNLKVEQFVQDQGW